jgi:nucleoid-associated protein YgaU
METAAGREQGVRNGGGVHGRDQRGEWAKRAGYAPNSKRGSRASTHVVETGQSLWLIAESLLGDGASDAKVAAGVERLWQLNGERIGTGDPDLIYPGQELRLT